MSKSSDPRRFFESDAEQSKRARREAKSSNKLGSPIILKSKLAAAVVDPHSPSCIFVAETAGSVRRVNIDDGDFQTAYRGPSAPVTCVAVGGPENKTLFAGCWDKNIWSWDIESKQPGIKFIGHSDFVKAVVCARINDKTVLVSGGADKKIMVWDIASGARLHTLQDTVVSMLAVQSLVVDPVQSSADEVVLVSSGSDPQIRRWKVRLDGWELLVDTTPGAPNVERRTILEHETGIYKLVFDVDGDEVDLWTASGDGMAKSLSRQSGFTSDDSFDHGDHVRAVALSEQWVITAGRDEDIKVWNRTSGKLYCSLQGHYDEVTDMVILKGGNGQKDKLVSVSIDGTVRIWPLDKTGLDTAVQEQEKVDEGGDEDKVEEKPESSMTADEEAELAELMEDD